MKRLLSLLLALCMVLSLLPGSVFAADEALVSDNEGDHNYINVRRWTTPVYSYLEAADNGGFTRIEAFADGVAVEEYDSADQFVSRRNLPRELPLFGGYFRAGDDRFLVFGQKNPDELDSAEVIRVVKYDKAWNRIADTRICGANTYIPFEAGSLRMASQNGILYVLTSHQMYADENGTHHQANAIFAIRIRDMALTDQFSKVMNVSCGYVSHSFRQVEMIIAYAADFLLGGLFIWLTLSIAGAFCDEAFLKLRRKHIFLVCLAFAGLFLVLSLISFISGHGYDSYSAYRFFAPFLCYAGGTAFLGLSMLKFDIH